MKKNSIFLFLLLLTALPALAQKDSVEAVIVRFFDGLSELDPGKLKETTTPDFLLLEHGEVWNLDTLVQRITPLKGRSFKRVNRFSFLRIEQAGSIAWISYRNWADFTVDGRQASRHWLESAVLVRERDGWKIRLLHSTRVPEGK
ncbi:MAG TPA: nuclear transport factor 2 family protein [Chitinophagaceae bacterium]|jgi:hypothetical protein|nr:nuclear transport factor 2 family protein [Chitinophagaceae bacterium]